MSGYLQRMVAGAAHPAKNMRPLARPMFADRPAELREEISEAMADAARLSKYFADDEIPQFAAPRRSEDLPVAAAESVASLQPQHGLPAHDAAALLPRSAAEKKIARAETPAIAIGRRKTQYEKKLEAAWEDKTEDTVGANPEVEAEDQQTAAPRLLVERLVAEAPERQERNGAEQRRSALIPMPASMAAAATRHPRQARMQQREVARESAAQDVEIHIGRIEVVAVPPPAAQRAPAPVSKTTSLSDYLKQANGRRR